MRDLPQPIDLIDIGSGTGLPGVPLRIAVPELRLTLLDSLGKRTRFLSALVHRLELTSVSVVTARAEDPAKTRAIESASTRSSPGQWLRCRCCSSSRFRSCGLGPTDRAAEG